MPTPSPAARPSGPRVWITAPGESQNARPGQTHLAGGEAPERLAAPPQHDGRKRSGGRRDSGSSAWTRPAACERGAAAIAALWVRERGDPPTARPLGWHGPASSAGRARVANRLRLGGAPVLCHAST